MSRGQHILDDLAAVPAGNIGQYPAYVYILIGDLESISDLNPAAEAILYIGYTTNLQARLRQHRASDKAFSRAEVIGFSHPNTARLVEKNLIDLFRPVYNHAKGSTLEQKRARAAVALFATYLDRYSSLPAPPINKGPLEYFAGIMDRRRRDTNR